MGQKVNPHGLRVGVIKDWDSRWYAREDKVGDLVVEDYNIRKYLKSTLYSAGIAKIEIERDNAKVKISIHCSRPGVIIGKGGTEIEVLRKKIEAKLGKTVALNIVEVRSPDLNAQLVAENIAAQLEKRISFRRAMKQAIQRATRLGAKGIKCTCGGQVWIKIFPDKPVSKKALGVRMGSGKGAPEYWVAVVKNQKVMFEIGGVSEAEAREALRLAQHKLPIKTKIIAKEAPETENGGE